MFPNCPPTFFGVFDQSRFTPSINKVVDATKIVLRADPAMPVEADGEIRYRSAHALEIQLLPGALRILA